MGWICLMWQKNCGEHANSTFIHQCWADELDWLPNLGWTRKQTPIVNEQYVNENNNQQHSLNHIQILLARNPFALKEFIYSLSFQWQGLQFLLRSDGMENSPL